MTEKIDVIRGNMKLTWILRVFLMLVALFFMVFSFDVFAGNETVWKKILGFLIHNVFTFALLIILFVVWKWEHVGGFLLLAMALFMLFFLGGPANINYGTWIIVSLPFIAGLLFLFNYYFFKSKI